MLKKSSRLQRVAWLLALAPWPSGALAGDAPVEELLQTSVPFADDPDEWQFDAGIRGSRNDSGSAQQLAVAAQYSLSDSWQVELEWDAFARLEPEGAARVAGIGDAALELQYTRTLERAHPVQIAAILEVGLPVGDESRGLREEDAFGISGVVGYAIPRWPALYLIAELGVEHEDSEQEAFGNLAAALKLPRGALTLELNWAGDEQYLTPGLAWSPTADLEVRFGVAAGLSGESGDSRWFVQASFAP